MPNKKGFSVPANYQSKDVIDLRGGQSEGLLDRARDALTATRHDWEENINPPSTPPSMTPPSTPPPTPRSPIPTSTPPLRTPSYKTGGVVGKTGMAMVHKGETIIPAEANGGETVPHRVIPPDAGWLVCPKNVGQYTGQNKPWRQ